MKTKPPLAYDLYAGGSKLKLPCQSPVSSLTLLRFTEPCRRISPMLTSSAQLRRKSAQVDPTMRDVAAHAKLTATTFVAVAGPPTKAFGRAFAKAFMATVIDVSCNLAIAAVLYRAVDQIQDINTKRKEMLGKL